MATPVWPRPYAGEHVARLQTAGQEPQQVDHLLRVVADVPWDAGIGEGGGGDLVTAGCPANAQVDASGVQRPQDTEVLRHLQRTVVGEHHATAAHPDGAGAGGDLPDEHLGAGAGEIPEVVVLGDPKPVVAQGLGGHRQLDGLPQGLGCGTAVPDWGLVHHAQGKLRAHVSPRRRAGYGQQQL